jgi:hypothetical protein
MPFKPNYRLQRADRQIAKQNKLQKKMQRRAEKGTDQDAPDQEAIVVEASSVDLRETEKTSLPS